MKHYIQTTLCAGIIAAFTATGVNALADNTIYNSLNGYNGFAFSVTNGQEIGNEISLAAGMSLDQFQLEYNSPSIAFNANVGIDVRFYLNDGTPENGFATPGTIFFDSGWFYNTVGGLPANGSQIITYNNSDLYAGSAINLPPGFTLPTDFTFTVSFTNLDADNLVNLPLANSQAGISYGDYWINNNGLWSLDTNSAPANLMVNFVGTPEPSVFYLGALGAVVLLGASRLKRKSA